MNTAAPALPELEGVSHRTVDVGGVELHVAEAGEGPPLVLLHGWPQHWWSWRRVIRELAKGYRVLVPDLRGFGWSQAPPGAYAKATFADDVVALLDSEGIDSTRIIGHDWGGYAAFLLALGHPERVEGMIALDIPPPWAPPPHVRQLALPVLSSYQALLATPVLGAAVLERSTRLVSRLIRAASGPRAVWSDAELDVYAEVLAQPARARASSACYRTFLTRELPTVLRRGDRSGELRVPTLLLMGGRSPIHRALGLRSSGRLEVRSVDGVGHFVPEEAPEAVLDAAAEWFAG